MKDFLKSVDYSAEYEEIRPSLFRESPVLDMLLETIFSVCDSQQKDLLWVAENLLNVDVAVGYHLDLIGSIVGQPRFLSDFNTEPYFGFEGSYQSKTFGSANDPSVGGYWNSRSYFNTATSRKLTDSEYRRLIKARVIYNQSNCTTNDLVEVVNLITNSQDNTIQKLKHGLIQISTDDSSGVLAYYIDKVSVEENILPIAAGVRVVLNSIQKTPVDKTFNNIGIQGTSMFGIGITDTLPDGVSEMDGTTSLGHVNYGNYRYSDGSIMCWIPQFYYRWGATDSPRAAKYGLNACDVKSKYEFDSVEAANAAGYALHRAFYDGGQIKDGFFVDKYQASNNGGIASSLKNGIPLSSSSSNAPFSSLTGSPANTYAGAIDAVKTRGMAFFVTTLFVQRALSLLSMAHAQAATSVDNCAWYDPTGVTNYPKGNNNYALGDVNDATVTYTATGYLSAGKTGSATQFAKTTHNGQSNGVADLNGNMYDICLGVTQLSGTLYVLKTTAKASALTSGAREPSDAWGEAGIAANYESLGSSIGALTGTSRGSEMGNGTQQVFSSAMTGKDWQASCAGIPLATGVNSTSGTDLFGHDTFYDKRVDNDMCPRSGGSWSNGALSGVWNVGFSESRASSAYIVGVRAAMYI